MKNRFEGGITMNKIAEFRILDLFCGAGGFSYGMHRNKHFKTAVALDFNVKAADTFKKNMPEAIVVTGDITDEKIKKDIVTEDKYKEKYEEALEENRKLKAQLEEAYSLNLPDHL